MARGTIEQFLEPPPVGRALVEVWERDEGAEALVLDGHDVLDGAVGGIAGHLAER